MYRKDVAIRTVRSVKDHELVNKCATLLGRSLGLNKKYTGGSKAKDYSFKNHIPPHTLYWPPLSDFGKLFGFNNTNKIHPYNNLPIEDLTADEFWNKINPHYIKIPRTSANEIYLDTRTYLDSVIILNSGEPNYIVLEVEGLIEKAANRELAGHSMAEDLYFISSYTILDLVKACSVKIKEIKDSKEPEELEVSTNFVEALIKAKKEFNNIEQKEMPQENKTTKYKLNVKKAIEYLAEISKTLGDYKISGAMSFLREKSKTDVIEFTIYDLLQHCDTPEIILAFIEEDLK